MQSNDDISEEFNSLLVFRLGGRKFATSIKDVHRILAYTPLQKDNDTPDFVEGCLEFHETIFPVIDVSSRLGLEKSKITEQTTILIISYLYFNKTFLIGFLTDQLTAIHDIVSKEKIIEIPGCSKKGETVFKEAVRLNNQTISIIDFKSILTHGEIYTLTELLCGQKNNNLKKTKL